MGDRLLDEDVGNLEAGDRVIRMIDRRRTDERNVRLYVIPDKGDVGEPVSASSQSTCCIRLPDRDVPPKSRRRQARLAPILP